MEHDDDDDDRRRAASQVPGGPRDRLAQLYEREARIPGTLAYRSRLERTRPWRDLAAVLLVTALILLALVVFGGSPADLGRLLLR